MFFAPKIEDFAHPRPHVLQGLGQQGRSIAETLLNACPKTAATPLHCMAGP
jgi:hypothetical protein